MSKVSDFVVNASILDLESKRVLRSLLRDNIAPGAGITAPATVIAGAIHKSSVVSLGDIIHTKVLIGLKGLKSSTNDLDIIGLDAALPSHMGRITADKCGTVFAGKMTCLEVPTTGVVDIDLYSAAEGTGLFSGAVASLTETALITSGGNWTLVRELALVAMPADGNYLYLANGAAGVVGTYGAGKFLLEMWGYQA